MSLRKDILNGSLDRTLVENWMEKVGKTTEDLLRHERMNIVHWWVIIPLTLIGGLVALTALIADWSPWLMLLGTFTLIGGIVERRRRGPTPTNLDKFIEQFHKDRAALESLLAGKLLGHTNRTFRFVQHNAICTLKDMGTSVSSAEKQLTTHFPGGMSIYALVRHAADLDKEKEKFTDAFVLCGRFGLLGKRNKASFLVPPTGT